MIWDFLAKVLRMEKPAWGLVLSGGAAWGLANVGVLRVLEDEGLKPSCISGSSMGAIVGALYALGHSAKEMEKLIANVKPLEIATLSSAMLKGGLHGGILEHQIEKHLGPIIGDAVIGDCQIPFVCVAGKVKQRIPWEKIFTEKDFTPYVTERVEPWIFPKETRIIDALRASCAIPVVFSPAVIDGDEYVDLIAFGAVPSRSLKETCCPEVIIGTDCNPLYEGIRNFLPLGWRTFIEAGASSYRQSLNACDLVLNPAFTTGPMRFDKAKDYVQAGKDAAKKDLPLIRELLGTSF